MTATPETVIRLTEAGGQRDEGFTVKVGFGDYAEYQVVVTDPADEAAEKLLAWYFEKHLRFPSWTRTWSSRRSR